MSGAGLDDLYQRVILDHSRAPRNFGALPAATHRADGENPVCGDTVSVALTMSADGRVADIKFEGAACAIATASASMMTAAVRGKTAAEIAGLLRAVDETIRGQRGAAGGAGPSLGDLGALAGVARFPVRINCARLPWQTLAAAMTGAASDR
jgi:nitrogen fixation NifU-like protein